MKQRYRCNLVIVFALICGLATVVTSCIKEDLSGCIPDKKKKNIRLSFTFPVKESGSYIGIDPKDIKDIRVFVFDQSETYIKEIIDDKPEFKDNSYSMDIVLDEGEYNFMVWSNLNGCYQVQPYSFVEGETRLSDILLLLNHAGGDTINFRPHPLFFASKREVSVKSENSSLHYVLPVIQDTYTLHLAAEGLPVGENKYRFVITDTNDTYAFDNSFAPAKELHYIGDCIATSNCEQVATSITTMRMDRNRHPQLKLYNTQTGALVYQEDLMTLLLWMEEAGGELDFSRIYEYDILLRFTEDAGTGKMTVSIVVNDWTVIKKEVVIDLS